MIRRRAMVRRHRRGATVWWLVRWLLRSPIHLLAAAVLARVAMELVR